MKNFIYLICFIFASLFAVDTDAQTPTARPYGFLQIPDLIISQDKVRNMDYIVIEGHNTAVGTTEEIIAENGGTYPFPITLEYLRVAAGGNAADTGAGAGARKVIVFYLDSLWVEQTDTLTLAGALISVDSTFSKARRLQKVVVYQTGAYGVANTAAIVIENAASGDVLGHITAAQGVSHTAVYTVESGYTAWVMSVSSQVGDGNSATINAYVRANADVVSAPFSPAILGGIRPDANEGSFVPKIRFQELPEKTDIYFTAIRTGGTDAEVSIHVELIKIKN